MTGRIKSQDMHSGFKGELIENELYQSADNVIDCKNKKDTVRDVLEDSITAPRFREKTPIKLEIEDQYSYPSKWTKQFKTKTTPKRFIDKISNLRLEKKSQICQHKTVTMTFFNVQIILREDKPVTCTCIIIEF